FSRDWSSDVCSSDLQQTNEKISAINTEIRDKNQELSRVNDQLLEANLIKEEYIGFFFTQDADIFEKFRDFKLKVEQYLEQEEIEIGRASCRERAEKR